MGDFVVHLLVLFLGIFAGQLLEQRKLLLALGFSVAASFCLRAISLGIV